MRGPWTRRSAIAGRPASRAPLTLAAITTLDDAKHVSDHLPLLACLRRAAATQSSTPAREG
jgi:hypothetical protein